MRLAAPIRISSKHNAHTLRSPKSQIASGVDQSAETVGYRLELAEAYEPWLECVEELKLAGLDQAAAEKAVSKAYGWTYSAYWRGEKVRMVASHRSFNVVSHHSPAFPCSLSCLVLKQNPGSLNLPCEVHQKKLCEGAPLQKETAQTRVQWLVTH